MTKSVTKTNSVHAKSLLAGVAVIALGISAASAADIPRRQAAPPAAAPVYVADPVYNWTGFYLGVAGGGGWGTSNFNGADYHQSGGIVSGTLGYNFQVGQTVFGVEGDMGYSNIRGSGGCGVTTCDTANKWLGTVRGRLGYAMGNYMPYVTGGWAFGKVDTQITGVGNASDTRSGWTVGGGVEAALAGPWTAKVEYLHVDLGRGGTVAGTDASFRANIVRAGLNYRF